MPRPRIGKEGGLLVVESTWRTGLWTLGSRHRRVVVDPKAKTIKVGDRYLWLIAKSRRIEFEWIESIAYTYHDLAGGPWAHSSLDLFCVALRLKDGTHLNLFRFFGEGEFVNDSYLPDWMYWDQLLANRVSPNNTPESESRLLVDLIGNLADVPIVND